MIPPEDSRRRVLESPEAPRTGWTGVVYEQSDKPYLSKTSKTPPLTPLLPAYTAQPHTPPTSCATVNCSVQPLYPCFVGRCMYDSTHRFQHAWRFLCLWWLCSHSGLKARYRRGYITRCTYTTPCTPLHHTTRCNPPPPSIAYPYFIIETQSRRWFLSTLGAMSLKVGGGAAEVEGMQV
jgi:hypothetical protein